MMNMKALVGRVTLAAAFVALLGTGVAEAQNTIVARYSKNNKDGIGNEFSIDLINHGGDTTIAGFAFRIMYDPSQVSLERVSNNTGQPESNVHYTMGPETKVDDRGTTVQRVLSATTTKDLTDASYLAELHFKKKSTFSGPLKLEIQDRLVEPFVDGLQGRSLDNLPHTFDVRGVNR